MSAATRDALAWVGRLVQENAEVRQLSVPHPSLIDWLKLAWLDGHRAGVDTAINNLVRDEPVEGK